MRDPIASSGRKLATSSSSSKENLDRFIPNRAATKFDYVMERDWRRKAGHEPGSPAKEAYRQKLRKVFNLENPRILAYKNIPSPPVTLYPEPDSDSDYELVQQCKPVKPSRHIPMNADTTLDAPDLLDDYYVNLLDWGSSNVLAIALDNTVYLWNADTRSASELLTVSDATGPVTSVSWAPDGCLVAVGFDNSEVQIWDSTAKELIRTLRGHLARVGSLAWNKHILSSGSMTCNILNSDVRVRDHFVGSYLGHQGQVCGLKWSHCGQKLASGGNDNLVYIWDPSMTSAVSTSWLHRFEDHRAAVRALAWCPFQSNMLASGGGGADGCIKFWNTNTGSCLNSVDTGSQVCSLLWSKTDRELLSSHGAPRNQLTLWKYPSMSKMGEIRGHNSRVLFTAQSPDGCKVASAAGAEDETLRTWNVFGDSEKLKLANRKATEPFANFARYSSIR